MANEYLQRTPTSVGNQRVWTWSGWVKRNSISDAQHNLWRVESGSSGDSGFRFDLNNPADSLRFYLNGATGGDIQESAKRRDLGSWMHIMAVYDSTASTSSSRVQLYVNGARVRSLSTESYPTLNYLSSWNGLVAHKIGASTTEFSKQQLTDIFFVDGQALTPDVFGFNKPGKGYISVGSTQATDFRAGQWVPKTPRIIRAEINRRGGFGVNGFYLPMNDSNNFGADFHGTPNSIIKLQENLPQPRCRIDGVGDYTGALREDPFKQYLVLALPFVSGGLQNGFGDYSVAIRGSGTPKTITNSNVSIATTASYYGNAGLFNGTSSQLTIPASSDFDLSSTDFTIEMWANPRILKDGNTILSLGTGGNALYWVLYVGKSSGAVAIGFGNGGWNWTTSPIDQGTVIRTNQWNHVTVVRKSNIVTTYVNGTSVGITTNFNFGSGSAGTLYIGSYFQNYNVDGSWFDGYIQDLRIYKGVAKYTGGFDVPNHYTPVGIATWRAVPDTTANNFATLNPLYNFTSNNTYTNGNLKAVANSNAQVTTGNIGFSTGRWYWETRINNDEMIGLAIPSQSIGGYPGENTNGFSYHQGGAVYYNTPSSYGAGWSYPAYHIVGIAIDWTNRRAYWHVDGVWANNANPSNGTGFYDIALRASNVSASNDVVPAWRTRWQSSLEQVSVNFGQNPSFGGEESIAGTFTDSNGKGLFKYQPPSGFLALCEDNLPTPAISDPGKYFKTVLWTGDGNSGRSIVGVGFTPDLVWLKSRTVARDHCLFDSVRGNTIRLQCSNTNAEESVTQSLLSFNADGFSHGTSILGNNSGETYTAWCWRAGAGTTSTNTNGSITSVVSVNQDAGFSIVSYTGTGANVTVGHGLGRAPSLVITKRRDSTGNWLVQHKSAGVGYLLLNSTNAYVGNDSSAWNLTFPTSSVFSISTGISGNMIAYCWAEIEGFSKFGSYVGNGSADGPFVYTGGKPAFIMVKRTDSTGEWFIFDSSRNSSNSVSNFLQPNSTNIEVDGGAGLYLDFLSNGFKWRSNAGALNASGGTYIFAAFAESPFTTANAK